MYVKSTLSHCILSKIVAVNLSYCITIILMMKYLIGKLDDSDAFGL